MRYGRWEALDELGKGGQGRVYRAVDTAVVDVEGKIVPQILRGVREVGQMASPEESRDRVLRLLGAIEAYVRRGDDPKNCGALKVLHPEIRNDPKARRRMEREVEVLSGQHHSNIVTILDSSVSDGWFVTEYFPLGSLARYPTRFRRQPIEALVALRSLVEAVASLHGQGISHRDIAPKNMFLSEQGLILGDFGLVYEARNEAERLSSTYENVGSRDWMPPWAMGTFQEEPSPAFDVFSLGKVLWAMISGRHILQLWYFRQSQFDLENQFPGDASMVIVNDLLSKCIVQHENECLPSAQELVQEMDKALGLLRGGPVASRRRERKPLAETDRERLIDALRASGTSSESVVTRTVEALKDINVRVVNYAIEDNKVLMRLVMDYMRRPNVEAASVAADIVCNALVTAPESVGRPWIKEALAECRQLCLEPRVPAGVLYGILRVLALVPERDDGDYLAYAVGQWPDELYDRASPMGWLRAAYKMYPLETRDAMDVLLQEGNPTKVRNRASEAQGVMRAVDQARE